MWERGLKRLYNELGEISPVAPHVGAWIETKAVVCSEQEKLSLPMWERGLKLSIIQIYFLP